MKKRFLEICVDSLQSALIAEEAGADRIELCSALDVGGLTPDPALFMLARQKLNIPIHVLIRPRSGNFVYDSLDEELMVESIRFFEKHGANGVVIGALTDQNAIDVPLMEELMKATASLSVTFHRAFDQLANPTEAVDILYKLGVERILTSGQKATAEDGLPLLQQLLEVVEKKLIILPGGGVNSENAAKLLAIGLSELHASVRENVNYSTSKPNVSLSLGGLPDEYRYADYQEIVKLHNIIHPHET